MDKIHQKWMQIALKEARIALKNKEFPVGAIIVQNNQIIARGYNQVELLQDATAHAEMIAITSASSTLGYWRLNECAIYVTKEPCPMCAGAIVNSRIDKLYFGYYDEELGACGSRFDICGGSTPSIVKGNILANESLSLIQEYFIRKRKEK